MANLEWVGRIDWNKQAADAIARIRLLRATFEMPIEPGSNARELYLRDIGIPVLGKLIEFCECVNIEGQP